jgi:hypothetical protein
MRNLLGSLLCCFATTVAVAQPGDCVVNILNRSGVVGADGRWRVDSVPANQGLVRARFTCTNNGVTQYGQTPFFQLRAGQTTAFPAGIPLGNYLVPSSLRITAPQATLNGPGSTTQATAMVTFHDNTTRNVTAASTSTSYFTSNPQIATVSADGLITATGVGSVIVTALYDGVSAFLPIDITRGSDSDGDGIPDPAELAMGLLPNNPTDALEDPDGDGLTNLDEYRLNSDIRNADTDGDGIPDGLEVRLGLNVRQADATTTVAGRVTDGGGVPVAGVTVTAFETIASATDVAGNYLLRFVPANLGPLTLQALLRTPTVRAGTLTGLAPAPASTTNAPVLVLSGDTGIVTGLITNPQGQAVTGAAVTLQTGILSLGATTDAFGRYRFDGVPAGAVTLTALDLGTGARGSSSGALAANTSLTVNVPLSLSGAVAGTVTAADGVTLVARARVTLTAGATTVTAFTDVLGRYRFEVVPVGGFTVDADLNGDRGRLAGTLTAPATTATADLRMLGVGAVTVTALQAGTPLIGIQVRLTNNALGVTYDALTDTNGLASFPRVVAGAFGVVGTRTNPAQTQNGSGTLAVNGSASITLVFDAGAGGASVSGRVLQSDNSTVVPGAAVQLRSAATNVVTDTQNAALDGTYRFASLPIGTYSVEFQQSGALRSREIFAIAGNTDAVVRDLVAVATGTVRGTVRNPDNSPAAGQTVNLQSQHPAVGGFYNGVTAADGTYSIAGVPTASFLASVLDGSRLLSGEAVGSVGAGSTVTADISLQTNTVGLPRSLWDANNRLFDVQNDGRIQLGDSQNAFTSTFNGASRLELTIGPSTGHFTGEATARAELGGRQLAVRQLNLNGMRVVRKVYVPRDGYFARFVEFITNPTAGAVTLTARARYPLPSMFNGYITSSGDTNLDVADAANPDRWIAVAANPTFPVGLLPIRGIAFDSSSARTRATAAIADGNGVVVEWANLTIPPGGSIGLMHFLAQHPDYETSRVVLQHLTRTPPEALAGLTGEEVGQIQNFALHPDAVSYLAPQPPLGGSISTTVLDWSGAIPVASTRVDFLSNSAFFNRTMSVTTSAAGGITLANAFSANGTSTIVPLTAYRLRVTNPLLQGVASGNEIAEFPGTFTGTVASTPAELRLTGTGNLSGSLTFPSGATPTYREFRLNNSVLNTLPVSGPFVLPALPAGPTTVQIDAGHPQGTRVLRSLPVTIRASETQSVSLFPPMGNIAGQVTQGGSPMPGVRVRAAFQNTIRETLTDAVGNYRLTDLDVAEYPLTAELGSNRAAPQTIVVIPGQQVVRNLELLNPGSVEVRVLMPPSTPVAGATVGSSTFTNQVTGVDGRATFSNLPLAPTTFSVYHPSFDHLEASGTVTPGSPAATLDLIFPETGTVTGIATRATGSALVNAQVNAGCGGRNAVTFTNAQGRYTLPMIPAARNCTANVWDSGFQMNATSPVFQIPSAGATFTQDLRLPAVATLRVTFRDAASQPIVNGTVVLNFTRNGQPRTLQAGTDATGVATINNVTEGLVAIQARRGNASNPGVATSSVTIRPQDDLTTVSVVVTLGAPGTVRGTVFAADGVTPLPDVSVDVYDLETGVSVLQPPCSECSPELLRTDENGVFDSGPITVGALGFRVSVVSPDVEGPPIVIVSNTGQFTAPNQIVTRNLTTPYSVVRGTVYRSDGVTPVSGANVFVNRGADVYFSLTDAFGRYRVFNVALGTLSVQVQQGMLFREAVGTLVAANQPVNIDLTLEPSATLQGIVRNAANQPVADAVVGIGLKDPSFSGATTADASGSYIQTDVPLGNLFVEAQDPVTLVGGLATVTLSVANEVRQLDVALESTGSIAGQARQAPSSGLPNADVRIESLEIGPLGGIRRYTGADSSGNFSLSGFAAGPVRALATNVNDTAQTGFADTIVSAGQLVVVNPQTGNTAVLGQANLDGANGFRYGLGCGGVLAEGGTTDRRLQDPFQSFLQAPGAGCQDVARLSPDGRQLEFGPQFARGLSLTRRAYVPSNGKFVRYLDSFTNTTALSTVVEFAATGSYNQWSASSRLVVDPSTNNRTFAVTDDPGTCCTPSLAVVMGGPSARTTPLDMRFPPTGQTSVSDFAYRWRLTVPAGQTLSILQFVVQRDRLDATGAIAQAQALVNLSDPDALTGLSVTERAQVLNFNIP